MNKLLVGIACSIVGLLGYTVIGTSGSVDEIMERVPAAMDSRNWEVLRHEGFQYGSFAKHGGKVFYHVKDRGHKNTYYRVHVTLWNDELQFYYGKPETLTRFNFDAQ